jgi:hypothetical protein
MPDTPSESELDNIIVRRLVDEIHEKDERIKALSRWIVVLIGICLVLLALGTVGHDLSILR